MEAGPDDPGRMTCFPRTTRVLLITLVVGSEGEQDISRHSAEPRIAGVDENHAIDDDGAGAVEGTAVGLDSVDGGIGADAIEIPEDLAIFGCKCTNVAVEGSRENHARQRRNGAGLRWTATGPRGITRLSRHEPGFRPVVQV